MNDHEENSLSIFDPNRSNNDLSSRHQPIPYSILKGPKNSNDLVDCQIIIVNARQRFNF